MYIFIHYYFIKYYSKLLSQSHGKVDEDDLDGILILDEIDSQQTMGVNSLPTQ